MIDIDKIYKRIEWTVFIICFIAVMSGWGILLYKISQEETFSTYGGPNITYSYN